MPPLVWAGAAFLPFVVLAVRALANRHHVFLNGDFALMDIQVREALRWKALVGVYSRFGWHHPGPMYLYLVSFTERITGPSFGAQAQVATAALIGGASVGGTVLVMGRLGGRLGAAAAAVAAAGVGIATGSAFGSAWNPFVVVFPTLLLGVLGVAAARGSLPAWAGTVVVATFVVQTDVGTGLYALAVVVGSGALLVRRRLHDGRWRESPRWPVTLALVGVALAAWVPPIIDQFSASGGNLGHIASFLARGHGRAGLVVGGATAGTAETASVGLSSPLFAVASHAWGLVRLGALAVTATTLLVWSRRAGDDVAYALSVVFSVGTLIAVLTAAGIVGAPFLYLMAWSGGISDVALVALAVLCARAAASRWSTAVTVTGVIGAVSMGAFLAWSVFATPLARVENTEVAAAWKVVAPRIDPGVRGVYVEQRTTGLYVIAGPMWGLVDELDQRGFDPRVGRSWTNVVGKTYVAASPGPVSVVLYAPAPAVSRLPGFAGHTPYADIVIVRRPA